MRIAPSSLALWAIAALLLLMAWLTVTGRLGDSRHGYGALRVPVVQAASVPLVRCGGSGDPGVSLTPG